VQSRINPKRSPTDQPSGNAGFDDALENLPEHVALTETLMTGSRERRMVRDLVLDRQPAKPGPAKSALKSEADHVSQGANGRRWTHCGQRRCPHRFFKRQFELLSPSVRDN
jgi:hypothetical protein